VSRVECLASSSGLQDADLPEFMNTESFSVITSIAGAIQGGPTRPYKVGVRRVISPSGFLNNIAILCLF
jgi:hypothetical protein